MGKSGWMTGSAGKTPAWCAGAGAGKKGQVQVWCVGNEVARAQPKIERKTRAARQLNAESRFRLRWTTNRR